MLYDMWRTFDEFTEREQEKHPTAFMVTVLVLIFLAYVFAGTLERL